MRTAGIITSSPFQSTPPEWGATGITQAQEAETKVSIHAPRVGSDERNEQSQAIRCCFNPRPPSGERPLCSRMPAMYGMFQSTPPEWGATILAITDPDKVDVSIHAPRVGSDRKSRRRCNYGKSFNPRPPSGERRGISPGEVKK